MKLIDSHCHLQYDYDPKTQDDIVREALEAGIETLITIGTDLADLIKVQEVSQKYASVFHTIGIHPHETQTLKDTDLTLIEEMARHPKCKAIGEIGLDYYYLHSPKEMQLKWCDLQLDLALKLNLPVVIHGRDAEEDLLRALEKYARKVPQGSAPGVIHCFTASQAFGQACIDLGFYISFSGILTFKNAEDLRTAARAFPLDKLLVETDAPFLAPIPFRGKKCEPAMVTHTARRLAEVKGVTLEEVARVTYENTQRLFRLSW